MVGLNGCGPGQVIHDKVYFAAHDALRKNTVAACQDNPGALAAEANCINATAAQADVDRQKYWTIMPPGSRHTAPEKL